VAERLLSGMSIGDVLEHANDGHGSAVDQFWFTHAANPPLSAVGRMEVALEVE
jgi:hypothetical protein